MPNLSSVAVANRFIELGIRNNKPVTQMDIYKLSYFGCYKLKMYVFLDVNLIIGCP